MTDDGGQRTEDGGQRTDDGGQRTVKLPEIGEIITTERAIELCRYFGLPLVERIKAHPERYKDWEFDGCSGLPDEIMGLFTGCDWRDITYQGCLPHDLRYAYGEPGNDGEKKVADTMFYWDLVGKADMKKWQARVFLAAVEIGGIEEFGLSFSWAFASKR